MGDGGNTQAATQETSPWGVQQPYLEQVMKDAQKMYQTNPKGIPYYSGQTIAPLGADNNAALDYAREYAQGTAKDIAQQTSTAQSALLQAPNTVGSPAFDAAANAAIRPVVRQFNESVLPGIRNTSIDNGQFGGSRQGVAEGIASDRLQQNILDTTSRMALQTQQAGWGAANQAIANQGQATSAGIAPASVLSTTGAVDRTYQQSLIDDAMQKYFYNQQRPYNALNQYKDFVSGQYGSGGRSTQQVSKRDPLMSGLGGAATGASIAASFGPAGVAVAPYAAAAGGIIGLIGG